MVLPSGHVVRIPPRSPFVAVMNQIAAITEAEQRLTHAAGTIAGHALYQAWLEWWKAQQRLELLKRLVSNYVNDHDIQLFRAPKGHSMHSAPPS